MKYFKYHSQKVCSVDLLFLFSFLYFIMKKLEIQCKNKGQFLKNVLTFNFSSNFQTSCFVLNFSITVCI